MLAGRKTLIVIAAVGSVIVALVAFWIALPYPLSLYISARKATRYHPEWPMTETEFRDARRIVHKKIYNQFEFIYAVHVSEKTNITFETVQRAAPWKGHFWIGGAFYTFAKQQNQWTLEESGFLHRGE